MIEDNKIIYFAEFKENKLFLYDQSGGKHQVSASPLELVDLIDDLKRLGVRIKNA